MKPWKTVHDTWKAKTEEDGQMDLSVSKFWENKTNKEKNPQSTNEAWEMAIANSFQYIKCFVYSK